MLTLYDLSRQISAYEAGQLSLDDFEDWFRSSSKGAYASSRQVSEVAGSVESALSRFYFQQGDEETLKRDLGSAIQPLVAYTAEAWTIQPVELLVVQIVTNVPDNVRVASIGANNSGPPFHGQSAESNATYCLIPAVI
jgi:hypothetical protein